MLNGTYPVDSRHLKREAKKNEIAYPSFESYRCFHPVLDPKRLPRLRSNTLLVAVSDPYGERESGIYIHEVNRPKIWGIILGVPWGFSFYFEPPLRVNGEETQHHRYVKSGNSICFSRFEDTEIGMLYDKEGRPFTASVVSAQSIECYFDSPLLEWIRND